MSGIMSGDRSVPGLPTTLAGRFAAACGRGGAVGRRLTYARRIASHRPNHYDVLGVDPTASADRIRLAYRELARRHHPDRAAADGDARSVDMSALNEAYRVLRDPGRRARYDRELRGGRTVAADVEATPEPPDVDEMYAGAAAERSSRLAPAGPARFPWKLMAVTAVLGSAVVLVAAAFTDPPSEEPPDGILRVGSCVEFESNGDAREVACTNTDDDIVVELLIPTDAECPTRLTPHRDRLGLGIACVDEG